MQFSSLLKDCAKTGCRQVDFFPSACVYCGKIYCPKHEDPSTHLCSKTDYRYSTIVCPICYKTLRCTKGQDSEKDVCNKHWASDCKLANYGVHPKSSPKSGYSMKTFFDGLIGKLACVSHKHHAEKPRL